MSRLIWRLRDGTRRDIPLPDGQSAVLGRESDLDGVVDAKSVSRRHARVDCREDGAYIVDLGSTNGTAVNGHMIRGPTPLRHGDLVRLGEETLEFDSECVESTKGALETAPLARSDSGSLFRLEDGAFPQRLGKFYLVRKLGQGGMGAVFQAIDLDSNCDVAVKFIRSHIGRREAFLDFFHQREAVLAREINHPNVIRVYEHGVEADQHYLSMEYAPGQNLFQAMKRRRLEPAEVLETLRQIACGLAAAHQQGVVHSDIKPANILLASEGQGGETRAGDAGVTQSLEQGQAAAILEFEDEEGEAGRPAPPSRQYDPGLLEEIRRRVGEPSQEVLVDPPYFPRLSETRFLEHYLARMLEGRGFFILIEGEAGMGKDRLVSEFLEGLASPTPTDPAGDAAPAPAETERARVLELDCSRIEGIPLLYEQLMGVRLASKHATRQMVDDLCKRLEGENEPVIVRVLNFGSAPALTCDLIRQLSELMADRRLLVLATLDPEEIRENGSLKPLLERLSHHTKELYLRPLTAYQIAKYLQQLYREAITGSDLAADLHRLSGGNFARLLDTLRSFFDRGILSVIHPSGTLRYRPRAQEFELEEGKTLYAKYRSFGKVEQRVLEQAAFIGPRFLFDTLLKFHNINETSLFFIVRTLLAEGFFVEESRTWYGFTNVAFQRYMADRTPAAERPHLHRKLSRLLQNVPVPESAELLELRARHLSGCREFAKAVQCLLEGAHLARNEYRVDVLRSMYQEVFRIYRELASREGLRREVNAVLRGWFRRDGNWYEILGELGSETPVPKVKIADFGISFRIEDEKRGYQVEKRPVLGTPRYLAPERVKGEHGGPPADIFSLGIIAYEMACGEPPFPSLRGEKVMEANRTQRIALPPEVLACYPPGMEALVAGMLAKEPQRRWDAERVLREVVKLQFDSRSAHPAQ
jgi:serine/threonine protein kinase